jgi:hypothetical protein
MGARMAWRDKLEIGLKENAPYRKDNLPPNEVIGVEVSQGPGRSAEIPHARATRTKPAAPAGKAPVRGTRRRSGAVRSSTRTR